MGGEAVSCGFAPGGGSASRLDRRAAGPHLLRGRPSKEKMEVSTRRKDRRDAEGEGRLGGPAGRGERGQPGSTPSSSLKPDLCVEEAASGAGGAGVRGWSMGAVGQPPEQRPRLD